MWTMFWISTAWAQQFVVQPYVQHVRPDAAVVMWEVDADVAGTVEFGPAPDALDGRAQGVAVDGEEGGFLFEAELTGLTAGERVHYRVVAGELASEPADVLAAPRPGSDVSFRVVAMSDMQRSNRDPDKFREVVQDGVLAWAEAQWGPDVASQFAMVLIPGDLVDDGIVKEEWEQDFFGPLAPLSAHVPVYAVPGNHERNSHWFFDYLALPRDGTPGFEEQWWSTQYANLVVVGLDSHFVGQWDKQLTWLDARLEQACADDDVDFLVTQLHHPYRSEVWTPGNSLHVGGVIERLEAFSTTCERPSALLFGHTHAYSRGQSRDHQHLMVNVASAGGALDYWGTTPQADYDEFSVSTDDWGFVVIDVEAGEAPSFTLRRFSRGDNDETLDNVLVDELTVRRHNEAPEQPQGVAPARDVPASCITFEGSPFRDGDGDGHQATHWQVAPDCDSFLTPAWEQWRQDRNLYFETDSQLGDDLTDEVVRAGLGEGSYCWRVRYRDAGLVWSEWSEPVAFDVTPGTRSANLLEDPGAESGGDGWDLEGDVVVDGAGRCGVVTPASGAFAFSLSSGCGEVGAPRLSTWASVSAYADAIDAGEHVVHVGLSVRGAGGAADVTVAFLGEGGTALGEARVLAHGGADWARTQRILDAPEGTRRLDLSVEGQAIQIDDVELSVGTDEALDCVPRSAPSEASAPLDEGCGGGCQQGRGLAGWWLLAVAFGWRRSGRGGQGQMGR